MIAAILKIKIYNKNNKKKITNGWYSLKKNFFLMIVFLEIFTENKILTNK